MSRYLSDRNDGVELRDDIGHHVDEIALRGQALQVVSALMNAEAEEARDKTFILSVRDESDAIVLKVRLACQIEEAWS
ncbi:hypothetical protein HPGCJGGD_0280 [Methylobacterium haplocladii]|nr:hypothetical protein HPGCJGGD_0280 [Methylobacterium haplocladii]